MNIIANTIEFVFSIALFINALLFIPQIIRIVKEKTAKGVSVITFLGLLLIQLTLVLHGFIVKDYLLSIGYVLSMLTCGSVVILALFYKKHEVDSVALSEEEIFNQVEDKLQTLENVIAVMPGNVYWLDKNGVYMGCNDNQAKVIGLSSRKEIVGKRNVELSGFLMPEVIDQYNIQVIQNGQSITVEEPGARIDGTEGIFLSSKVPLKNSKNEIVGIIGISIDITERKEQEKELEISRVQAEAANKAKSTFVANMSHDVRTPLSGIIGISSMMEKGDEYLTTDNAKLIHDAAYSLLTMMNKIFDFVRAESPDLRALQKDEIFSVSSVINDAIALYTPSANLKKLILSANIEKEMPVYLISKPQYLHKIIVNLIGNAIKFTDSGKVTVSACITQQEGQDYLLVNVADTGMGIPHDKRELVFDWFERLTPAYQGAHEGTGLGLAIVKQSIEALHGEISIEDNAPQGTVFQLKVPVKIAKDIDLEKFQKCFVNEEAFKDANRLIKQQDQLIGKKLLLIEDDKTAAIAASLLLEKTGFSVDVANTGEKGLAAILAGKYDVVISDIGLPDILGTHIVKQARDAGVTIPIYALTGHADVEKNGLLECGFTEVMTKPLIVHDFLKLMTGTKSTRKKTTNNKKVIDLTLATELGFDRETAIEMLQLFIEMLQEELQNLQKTISEQNIEDTKKIIHKLRGGASYACVPEFSDILAQAYETLKSDEMKDLNKLYENIAVSAEKTLKEAGKYT